MICQWNYAFDSIDNVISSCFILYQVENSSIDWYEEIILSSSFDNCCCVMIANPCLFDPQQLNLYHEKTSILRTGTDTCIH